MRGAPHVRLHRTWETPMGAERRVRERVPLGAIRQHLYHARLPFPISGFTCCRCRPMSAVLFRPSAPAILAARPSTATSLWPTGRGIIRNPLEGTTLSRVILAATVAGRSRPRSLVPLAPNNRRRKSPAQVPLSARNVQHFSLFACGNMAVCRDFRSAAVSHGNRVAQPSPPRESRP